MKQLREPRIIQESRQAALAYITAQIGADTALPIRVINPDRPDRTIFSSAYAALSLSVDQSEASLMIRGRLIRHLLAEREWFGTWRYWGKRSPIPCDLDDCSLSSTVLRIHGVATPDIGWLLALHRLPGGMFHAWLMPGNISTLSFRYWLAAARNLTPKRVAFRFFGPWQSSGKSHRLQYHPISNAHIIGYLGESPVTAAAIDWIIEIISSGMEEQREIYYRDREFLYLALGRAYSNGVKRFACVSPVILERVKERVDHYGSIGQSAFVTAAAIAALLHLGVEDDCVGLGVAWLIDQQSADGSWPAQQLDYDGAPPSVTGWGSCCLTTSVVVEALAQYESRLSGGAKPARS